MLIDDVEVKDFVDELLEADVLDEYVDEVLLHSLDDDELELLRTDVAVDFNTEVQPIGIIIDEMVEKVNADIDEVDEVLEGLLEVEYDTTDDDVELRVIVQVFGIDEMQLTVEDEDDELGVIIIMLDMLELELVVLLQLLVELFC